MRTANKNTSDRSNNCKAISEGGKELTDPVNVEGATAGAGSVAAEPTNLEERFETLKNEMKVLSIKNESLQKQILSLKFGFHRFVGSDDDMNYYTGMSSRQFLALFAFLNVGDICSRLRYWGSNNLCIQFPEL